MPTEFGLIASWNVEGLRGNSAVKLEELKRFMTSQQVGIICMQETHLEQTECYKDGAFGIFLSGTGDTSVRSYAGVGFMVSPRVMKSVVCFRGVSDRMATLRVKVPGGVVQLISAYAPQSKLPFALRYEFFTHLTDLVRPTTTHTSTIVMGDLNAKLGAAGLGEDNVIGPYSFKSTNHATDATSNRELLFECCHSCGLIVASSFFDHPPMHQVTYFGLRAKPMDEITETSFAQIDHVLVHCDSREMVTDCWSDRRFALNSRHFPLFASLRHIFQKVYGPRRTPSRDHCALRDKTVRSSFSKRFQRSRIRITSENSFCTQTLDQQWHATNDRCQKSPTTGGKLA